MSKIKDELMGAQDAVRTVADEALKKMELTELLFESFPDLEKYLGNRSARFSQTVKNILRDQQHPESNNVFVGQVAYSWLIEDGRPDDLDFDGVNDEV